MAENIDDAKEYARKRGWLAKTPEEIKRLERIALEEELKRREKRDQKIRSLFEKIELMQKHKKGR